MNHPEGAKEEVTMEDLWTCGFFLSKEPYKELAIKCFMCDSLFYTTTNFQKHLARIHSFEEEELLKPALRQNFNVQKDLSLQLYNTETEFKLEEDEILQEYYFGLSLESTIGDSILNPIEAQKEQKSGKRKAKKEGSMCHICGKIYKEHFQLQSHLRASHDKLRPYLCSKCPKNYARLTHLNDHMRSHSEQRDFVCNICYMTFRRSQELTRHKLRHQQGRNYKCSQCDAKFNQHSGLYQHLKIKHGKKNTSC
ncbi:PREDICTED: zinc finger protein 502-like [Drosophila arizonae]|uniref:Zinc finger protein 502-like n=1 Tax=Drosophila arizonae TaxID=7263 RepID=A0ABM1PKQ6_DROAR|nr:PREDICTED: zinc finger protein 502-like [Drosophila arizonae]